MTNLKQYLVVLSNIRHHATNPCVLWQVMFIYKGNGRVQREYSTFSYIQSQSVKHFLLLT